MKKLAAKSLGYVRIKPNMKRSESEHNHLHVVDDVDHEAEPVSQQETYHQKILTDHVEFCIKRCLLWLLESRKRTVMTAASAPVRA
jgi:hypothetical protein